MEERYKDICDKLYNGMLKKDVDILNTVLDNNFILVHMTGMRQTKKEFINSITNDTLIYYSEMHEKILCSENKIDLYSIVEASVFGGYKHKWNLRLSMKITNENKIVEAIASTY